MLFIICAHTGFNTHIPMAHTAQTTLFFLLSGYFFKNIENFNTFLKKSIETIVIPFLIFYLFSYFLFYLGVWFYPGFIEITSAKGVLDCFTQKQFFNGPLWFLLCLFWVRSIVWILFKSINNVWLQSLVVFFIGCIGILVGKYEIDLPLYADTALSSTPYFFVGYLLHKFKWMEKFGKIESGLLSFVFYSSCFSFPVVIYHSINRFEGSFFAIIYVSVALSIAWILLSRCLLNKSVILSFIGRNSMWLMCSHHLIYRPIKLLLSQVASNEFVNTGLVFVITLIICCITAPIISKYFPLVIGKGNRLMKIES